MTSIAPGSTTVTLTPAMFDDAYPLWVWANDPDTMLASGRPLPLSWEEHVEWLTSRDDERTRLFVAHTRLYRPIGTIRFDTDSAWKRARLSYGVARESRGFGFGEALILEGVRLLRLEFPGIRIQADVRIENNWSLRVIRGLGWPERYLHAQGMIRFTEATGT